MGESEVKKDFEGMTEEEDTKYLLELLRRIRTLDMYTKESEIEYDNTKDIKGLEYTKEYNKLKEDIEDYKKYKEGKVESEC